MKKKFSAALLAAAMLLSLTACGSGGETQSPAGTGEPSASAEAEFTPAEYAIGQITIGTTAAIESAVRDEYDYDMLASAVSEPPLVYQDLDGEYHPLLASYETADSVTWTYTILDGMRTNTAAQTSSLRQTMRARSLRPSTPAIRCLTTA